MTRILAIAVAVLIVVVTAPSHAAQPFDRQAFMAAQATGALVLLHVHAPWCPTCRAQEPTIAMIEKENPHLKVFRVDFDGQKEVVKELGVTSQSTLIAFSGKSEAGRSTGVTDPMKIRDLIAKAGMPSMGMDKKM